MSRRRRRLQLIRQNGGFSTAPDAELPARAAEHRQGRYAAIWGVTAILRVPVVRLHPRAVLLRRATVRARRCAGTVIAEARRFGLPVVATAVGGIPELLHDLYPGAPWSARAPPMRSPGR